MKTRSRSANFLSMICMTCLIPSFIRSETVVFDQATTDRLNKLKVQEEMRKQVQKTQSVTVQQQDIGPKWVQNQNKPAEMHAISNEEIAKQREQYNACKNFVGAAQKGAYDGRWSSHPSGLGQANSLLQTQKANQDANKCPPNLLRSRPIKEWQK